MEQQSPAGLEDARAAAEEAATLLGTAAAASGTWAAIMQKHLPGLSAPLCIKHKGPASHKCRYCDPAPSCPHVLISPLHLLHLLLFHLCHASIDTCRFEPYAGQLLKINSILTAGCMCVLDPLPAASSVTARAVLRPEVAIE